MHAQPASSRDGRCPTCGNADPFDASPEHRGLVMAVIKMAFSNWPESHAFQPTSPEHLRGWLCIEVGHKLSVDIDGAKNITVRTVASVRSLLLEMGSSEAALIAMRMYETKTGIRVVVPKSMSSKGPKRIGKREFEDLSRKIFEIVETVTGVEIEKWKGEQNKWHAA